MGTWTGSETTTVGGVFQIVMTPTQRIGKKWGGGPIDVTFFRGVPTLLTQFSAGDPFGDSTAVIEFPQITGLDELGGGETPFLNDFCAVDIYFCTPVAGAGLTTLDATTNLSTTGYQLNRVKVWEGHTASYEFTHAKDNSRLQVQCQGALFQVDKYLAKPQYPPRPIPHENLIGAAFDRTLHPNLRVSPLKMEWPAGWKKTQPRGTTSIYTPIGVRPGQKITGFSTRQTGSWDRLLTGFTQDLLAVMFTDTKSGVTPGNQWTIRKDVNRQPVLYVRDRFRTPDFTVYYGTPGIDFSLTYDLSQFANVIYGEGTSADGTDWRNAVVSNDGSRTDYAPLAWSRAAWPVTGNPLFRTDSFVAETYIRFGSGFNEDQAINAAEQMLARDADPGFTGSMVMKVDPNSSLSRYQIKPGMTVRVNGLAGASGGVNFHIAEMVASPQSGTVELKIDTKYRDLLTLEEAQARTRDPLTPVKALQVNRRSLTVQDVLAPWDYRAGSGFIPKRSTEFHAHRVNDNFPWPKTAKSFPPRAYPQYYVRVNADENTRKERWTLGKQIPIVMSQKGSIRRIEIAAFDLDGNRLAVEFHFSLYYNPVTVANMPFDKNGPSPFIPNAFESTTATGAPFPPGYYLAPDQSMIIGWGNYLQPAGYSPGSKSAGYPKTGLLVDEGSWAFDCTNNPNFDQFAAAGVTQKTSAFTVYGAFYCDTSTTLMKDVYFMGRMYREEPGT